jgi:transposase-like protein
VHRKKRRSFTQAFKQSAVARMATAVSIRGLAAELNVEQRMLYHWRDQFQTGGSEALRRIGRPSRAEAVEAEASRAPLDVTDPAEAQRRIDELERKIGQQQLELDFFARPPAFAGASFAACQGPTAQEGRVWRDNIYAVIHAVMVQQGDHPGIERMCAVTEVSRAGYYRHWLASRPRQEETALRYKIQCLSLVRRKNGYRVGYRLITIQLQRMGWAVNHKRVARIRREDNLLCVPKQAFRPPTTDGRHHWHVWPNLARQLVPLAINQLWVADITYIRMSEAFVYLAVVLDAFSRRVVGWAMADHLRAELALAALTMAIGNRHVTPGELIHHSDQGVQYACGDYIARLNGPAFNHR